jgi:peptide/nickel transport system substrate-binding protein
VLTAARPHYGGTLRLETTDAGAKRRVSALVYETLVAIDADGVLRPSLATSWDGDARGRRWRFRLRRGVKLHDSSTLQPSQIAAILQSTHSDWRIDADGDLLTVDGGRDAPDLPSQLADSTNAIAIRAGAGSAIGSGPFRVDRVDAGVITLRAHDDYWDGRPFLDAVEVRTARSAADQVTDVETQRADIVSIQPTDVPRIEQRQLRIESARPLELVALGFEASLATSPNDAVRRTLAAAIDRAAIARVVLQGRATPAEALLPQWVSGYAPFVLDRDIEPLSRSAVAALPAAQRTLALRVAAADPIAQAIAQRIAVNARDAGFTVIVQAPTGLGPRFDLRLLRAPLRAASPPEALSDVMAALGPRILTSAGRVMPPNAGASIEDVLLAERTLLARDVIVPVVHIPDLYAVGPRVQLWNGPAVLPSGAWNLANVWLSTP